MEKQSSEFITVRPVEFGGIGRGSIVADQHRNTCSKDASAGKRPQAEGEESGSVEGRNDDREGIFCFFWVGGRMICEIAHDS